VYLHSKTCRKAKEKHVYCLSVYLIIYERYNCIFWDIWQRNWGPSWRTLSSTLLANVTDYSNMMGPSFSVMSHFFVYFLLTLLNYMQRHRLFYCFMYTIQYLTCFFDFNSSELKLLSNNAKNKLRTMKLPITNAGKNIAKHIPKP